MKANIFLKENGFKKCSRIVEDLIEQGNDGEFVKHLKRLVESHDLVESYGGLFEAKIYADSEYRSLSAPQITKRLKQAITDVEGCQ